jgi:hypothetical protein
MGLPPSDFGGLKLTVASPLPAVAITLVGGLGMSWFMVAPPNAQEAVAVSSRAKIAVIAPMPVIALLSVRYLSMQFKNNHRE